MPGGVWQTTPGDGRNESGPAAPLHRPGSSTKLRYRSPGRQDTRSRVPSPVSSSLIGSDNGLLAGRCRTGAADYRAKSPGKKTTPTDRLSGFETGLATNSDSGERVPRGHRS